MQAWSATAEGPWTEPKAFTYVEVSGVGTPDIGGAAGDTLTSAETSAAPTTEASASGLSDPGTPPATTLVVDSIVGTPNQVIVTGTSAVTLSTPQDIDTGASPTFAGATLSGLTANSLLFAGSGGVLSEDTANLTWNDTSNQLLVGGTATNGHANTLNAMVLMTNNNFTPLALRRFSSDIGGPAIRMAKGRGTSTTPLRAKADDVLFNLNGIGYYAADDVTTATESNNASGTVRGLCG